MNMSCASASASRRGFSLVEITVALGLVSFTLIALIGLLTAGLQTNRDSADDVQAANLASVILTQRRAAPTAITGSADEFAIPSLSMPTVSSANQVEKRTALLTEDGSITLTPSTAFYRLTYSISPATNGVVEIYLALSRPPEETNPAEAASIYEVVTYIDIE